MPAIHELLNQLSQPAAFPEAPADVEVHQTHISIVFLAGNFAYKIKKPVQLGFLDFSTLQRRRHFCEEEVRLNRRLAPDVYLGVVPIVEHGTGLRFEGDGQPVEWAVKMRRLPPAATLESRVERDEVAEHHLQALAGRLARFHAGAAAGAAIAAYGRFDVVAGNMRENFSQTASHVGVTVEGAVYERVRSLTESALSARKGIIEARAARGVPRDTHGDLHLDHVYWFREQPPPGDWIIIDCIEFNERFRYADPMADVTFLAMDFAFHGRRDLAAAFLDAYEQASRDAEGRLLAPLYTAYRAVVRAKVEGIELCEKEIPGDERAAAGQQARAHWLLALDELEEPSRRPAVVLVGGLPGSGKSTLAQALGQRCNFQMLRSDVVRKELAGLAPTDSGRKAVDLYTAAWSERTYAELARRAEAILSGGGRVLIDANFRMEAQRRDLLTLARRWGVRAVMLECRAAPEVIRRRLSERRSDASDADWAVYQQVANEWELPGPATQRCVRIIDTADEPFRVAAGALEALRVAGLADTDAL